MHEVARQALGNRATLVHIFARPLKLTESLSAANPNAAFNKDLHVQPDSTSILVAAQVRLTFQQQHHSHCQCLIVKHVRTGLSSEQQTQKTILPMIAWTAHWQKVGCFSCSAASCTPGASFAQCQHCHSKLPQFDLNYATSLRTPKYMCVIINAHWMPLCAAGGS